MNAKNIELKREVVRLTKENTDGMTEALALTTALFDEHYRKDAPDWEPLDTIAGLISQVSNMVAGLSQENEQLKAERDEWKNTCVKAGCADLNGRNIVKDLEAERDRLRELLFSIGKYACGEDQLDVFSDTEALLELAKLVGHYDDPPRYSPEALNK